MDKIVPRWEWRTFGQDFGEAIARIAVLPAEKEQKSEETYLLAAGSKSNVKIRDELLDIKLCERVDSNGLEQWRPALKAPFPLPAAAVASARSALGLPVSPALAGGLSLEQFLSEIALPGGPVRVVNVSKTRKRYTFLGCVSELTDLVANGKSVRTVAIEDADASKVIAAVRAMGLERYPNVSYPIGLKQLLGLSRS
jgi:exopolyphosphatase/guanosine-5'-triphosphate,3'-diphosphate pyrophosphatase